MHATVALSRFISPVGRRHDSQPYPRRLLQSIVSCGSKEAGRRGVKGLSSNCASGCGFVHVYFSSVLAALLCCSTYWSLHIEGPRPTRISASLQVGLTLTMDSPAPEPERSINGGQELPSNDSWVRLFCRWLTSLKFFHGYIGLHLLLAVDPTSCPRSLHGCVGSRLTD